MIHGSRPPPAPYHGASNAVGDTSDGPPPPKKRRLHISSASTKEGPAWRLSRAPAPLQHSTAAYLQPDHRATNYGANINGLSIEKKRRSRTSLVPSRPNKDGRPCRRLHDGGQIRHRSIKALSQSSTKFGSWDPGVSNLFPWAGYHAEDSLNEGSTRNGYFVKVHTNANESASARPLVSNMLKREDSLPNLRLICATALQLRIQSGKIYSENTFKLPPRVTLTDSKRESWLAGLCNPVVPLRSLSRSIPHGIRGKALLEQCLNKKVPLSRAVWLVKCVGANEIRAFKRKGPGSVMNVGGEPKWLKEWTSNVQQFLTGILDSKGHDQWRHQYAYGLSLTSRLSQAQLLDHAQFLDWIVQGAGKCSSDMLMSWLILLNVYWRTIVNRGMGALLTDGLIVQARMTAKYGTAPNSEIHQLLRRTMMVSHQSCLATVKRQVCSSPPGDAASSGQRLSSRTCTSLSGALGLELPCQGQGTRSPLTFNIQQQLLDVFNQLTPQSDHERAALGCLRLTNDNLTIVRSCITWSTCRQRQANYRPLAASILMRLWAKHGVDLQGCVQQVLLLIGSELSCDANDLTRVIVELVSSRDFLVRKYCHWLMATGILRSDQAKSARANFHVVLLQHLSLKGEPQTDMHLCRSLLEGRTTFESNIAMDRVKQPLLNYLNGKSENDKLVSTHTGELDIRMLDQNTKLVASRWLYDALFTSSSAFGPLLELDEEEDGPEATLAFQRLPPANVVNALDLFAFLDDYTLYAESFSKVASSAKPPLLLVLCDSANSHIDALMWKGFGSKLLATLHEHLDCMNSDQTYRRRILETFTDLAHRFSGFEDLKEALREKVAYFHEELPLGDVTNDPSIAIISRNEYGSDTVEELLRILAKSTVLDAQLYERVANVTKDCLTDPGALTLRSELSSLLGHLRRLKPLLHKDLLFEIVETVLSGADGQAAAKTLTLLICSEMLSLDVIMDDAERILREHRDSASRSEISVRMLDLLTGEYIQVARVSGLRAYCFLDQRSQLFNSGRASILHLFRSTRFAEQIFEEPRATFQDSRYQQYSYLLNELLCGLTPANADLLALTSQHWVELGRCLLNLDACIYMHGAVPQCGEVLAFVNPSTLVLHRMQLLALQDQRKTLPTPEDRCVDRLIDTITAATHSVTLSQLVYLLRGMPTTCPEQCRNNPAVRSRGDLIGIPQNLTQIGLQHIGFQRIFALSTTPLSQDTSIELSNLKDLVTPCHSSTWLQTQPILEQLWSILALFNESTPYVESSGSRRSEKPSEPHVVNAQVLNGCRSAFSQSESIMSNHCLKVFLAFFEALTFDNSEYSIQRHDQSIPPSSRQTRSYGNGMIYAIQIYDADPLARILLRYSMKQGFKGKAIHAMLETGRSSPVLRRWEMISDAAPVPAPNDTCLNIISFGAEEA